MLKGQELDQFLDEFLDGARPAMDEKQDSPEELEEYQLPSDGLIIRQMKRQGKVSRRTWFALVLMLLTVPLLLYLSVRIFHGRKYLVTSLIVVVAAMLPFFMMFEGRKPKAREIMVISVLAGRKSCLFYDPKFQAGCSHSNPYRGFFWRRSRISGRLPDHDDLQYFHGAWTLDTMADVFFWNDWIPGRNSLPERNS